MITKFSGPIDTAIDKTVIDGDESTGNKMSTSRQTHGAEGAQTFNEIGKTDLHHENIVKALAIYQVISDLTEKKTVKEVLNNIQQAK